MRTAAFLAGLVAVSPAFVQDAAAQDAAVEALIQRGIQLRRNSADEDALAVFLEAEKQDPTSVRVLLHVVTAAQAAGKWLMADSYMRKVTVLSDDAYYRRHADAIDVVRRAIATRVGTFQAQGGPDGAGVRLDGQLVGTLPMNSPASVEAGSYVMEVYKPGFYRLRRNVLITGGVLTREPVELNSVPPGADLASGAAGDGRGAGADEPGWWQSPAVGWTFVGLGIAAGVGSVISFRLREDRAARWNDESECIRTNGDTRQEACGDSKSDAETFQTLGIVTAIAGVAFAGTGVALLLGGSEDSDGTTADSASLDEGLKLRGCNAGLLSLSCSGSF